MQKCNKFQFCLREFKSYNYVLDNKITKKENVHFIPDFVTYFQTPKFNYDKKDVLLCLRNDKEKIKNSTFKDIENYIKNKNIKIDYTDTVIGKHLNKDTREKYVVDKIDQFAKYKLVITDRLHGMIFSTLANTPCISFDNASGKVYGVYDSYLKDVDFVKCIGENETLDFNKIDEFLKYENCKFDNKYISEYYDKLIKICDSYLNS